MAITSSALLSSLSIALMLQSSVMAGEGDFQLLNYDIISEGEDVGDMTLKLSRKEGGYVVVEQSQIEISGWWWSVKIATVLSEEFQGDGNLVKADSKTVIEGGVYWTRMHAHDEAVSGEYIEITHMNADEEKKFSHLSFAVTGKSSNNGEEVISLSEAMLSSRNRKPAHQVTFPQGAFDTTFNNLPFFIQQNGDKPLPSKINILDTENLEISSASIEDLGVESLTIGNRNIQVRHITLSDGQYRPSHLWIKEDAGSLPYVVRHSGEDEDGEFDIVLKPD